MKFPYGIFDFREIVTQNYFYCDRTHFIRTLEDTGNYLLFIRPRRFGKSLLLSMLENYYDVAMADQFETLFGHLKIGQQPTPLHNRFFILKWDFSSVNPMGGAVEIQKSLFSHINAAIRSFSVYYRQILPIKIEIDSGDAVNSIKSMLDAVRQTPYPIYLLIDEYDNFANEVMVDVLDDHKTYEALVYEKGPLKTLFKVVKSLSVGNGFARTFITGVSPVMLSDITSGYNIAKNIYLNSVFNTLCGFEESEVQTALSDIAQTCELDQSQAIDALNMMRTWYNGYQFSANAKQPVYNPTLALYFLEAFQQSCTHPDQMLDANLAADEARLQYISRMAQGGQMILDLMQTDHSVELQFISDRFGIRQMLSDAGKDQTFLASLLYYFGVLTLAGKTEQRKVRLKVPNLVMRGLYVERLQQMLLPEPAMRDEGRLAAEKLYMHGDMQPLCDFVETRYFKVFHNRDYRWANELTVKTAFLTLLYNDILYVMDSEKEISRRYADLTMIRRPDMMQVKVFDILIEFKFISLGDAGLSGKQAGGLSINALKSIPAMAENMADARIQVAQYGEALNRKYANLNLKYYAVVSLGYERIWWEEMTEPKGQ
ncbi:MAG: AAA family ATPase [Pseudomonadota bacterium]